MTEIQRMREMYPDAELMRFDKAWEIIGKDSGCCDACPASYESETGLDCGAIPCAGGKVFVSPVLYIAARVSKWRHE